MRALRSFPLHKDGVSRKFVRGEEIPPEWAALIGAQSLVDEVLPHLIDEETGEGPSLERFPEFRDLNTVDEILGWAGEADDYEERLAKVNHALEAEIAGRGRKTLVSALRAFLPDATSDTDEE